MLYKAYTFSQEYNYMIECMTVSKQSIFESFKSISLTILGGKPS